MQNQQYVQVVLFGASITWSMRAPFGGRYADCLEAALARRLGEGVCVDVAACGAGGNTAREALPRIERDIVAYAPDLVVLNLGGNDAGREEKPVFEACFGEILDAIRYRTDALVVCETIPVLDEEWHAHRDSDNAKAAGGLNAHIEAFAHSHIRAAAAQRGLLLHDRFRIYHDALAKDPSQRERLIRRDGVHLTEAGNAFFAETLAEFVAERLHDRARRPSQGSAQTWLAKAAENPSLQRALAAADAAALRTALLEDEHTTRLELQQARSCARRAATDASDADTRETAAQREVLTAAFMGLQRVLHPATPAAETGSRTWARDRLAVAANAPAPLRDLLDGGGQSDRDGRVGGR